MTPPWLAAYRGRRVVVTGATGFIGSHVALALVEAGAEVVSVTRRVMPDGDAARAVPGTAAVVDLATPGAAAALIAQVRPAVTFNLAGYGVDPAEREAALAERLNTELPAVLAEACAAWRDPSWSGQALVHAGSALEYGIASGDLREDTLAQPTTLYGSTKEAGTRALLARAATAGLPVAVARLFTVYGAREHRARLLPTLRRAARGTEPVPLTAGAQRRDFTWVGDVVEGLLRLGVVRDGPVGVINLATGRLATVREFAERAAPLLGIAPERLAFGTLPTRTEEMAHDDVAVAKLEALTGWRPATSIEMGVRATLDPA